MWRKNVKEKSKKIIRGKADRPRLLVYRSNTTIYAQLIDDVKGKTMISVSGLTTDIKDACSKANKVEASKIVGKAIAEKAKSLNISKIVFDRNGYLYHGRVKALADAAREAGLEF
jgi:large subunit ribosomal protein L18